MLKSLVALFLMVSILTSCSNSENPISSLEKIASSKLEIQTSKNSYSWNDSDFGRSGEVLISLRNTDDQLYYARLGDGFAPEGISQTNLFVAEGSDAFIEKKKDSETWKKLSRVHLIEGVAVVALLANTDYTLRAYFNLEEAEVGQFRIRVQYFTKLNPPADATPLVDFSNIFIIE